MIPLDYNMFGSSLTLVETSCALTVLIIFKFKFPWNSEHFGKDALQDVVGWIGTMLTTLLGTIIMVSREWTTTQSVFASYRGDWATNAWGPRMTFLPLTLTVRSLPRLPGKEPGVWSLVSPELCLWVVSST